MFENVAFVGGIHGVGKSSMCIPVCKKIGLEYLSASEVLRWKDVSIDPGDKRVEDIDLTQDRLITGLRKKLRKEKAYLLDGHFCLFDRKGNIVKVPKGTFELIKPLILIVVVDDPEKIASRLGIRDGRIYDAAKLRAMQDNEVMYARVISETLSIPVHQVSQESNYIFEDLLTNLKNAHENIAGHKHRHPSRNE